MPGEESAWLLHVVAPSSLKAKGGEEVISGDQEGTRLGIHWMVVNVLFL